MLARYKISKADVAKAIEKVRGKDVKGLPNWFRKAALLKKDGFEVKNGKLLLEGKQVVPKEEIDAILRNAFYDKGSAVPWSRDAGYADISKRFEGISKRAFADFAQRQKAKIRTDNIPKKVVKKGRNLSKKGVIEIDLYQTSRKDLPTYIAKKYKATIDENPQHYTLTMVDKLTSLTYLEYIGTGAGTKSRKHVMPAVNRGRDWFAEKLGVPRNKQRFLRDSGGEFDPKLPGHTLKLGPAVEARNSFAQRVQHRLFAAKRGNLKEITKQTMDILNNTKSRISRKTPNEAAGIEQAQVAEKYNKSRQVGKRTPEVALKVGDMVRKMEKNLKKAIYKAYQGTQWSKKKYKIEKVSKSRPYKYFVDGHWLYRDQISNAEKPVDQISEARLAKLTATGKVKAIPKPKVKKVPSPIKPRPKSKRPKKKPKQWYDKELAEYAAKQDAKEAKKEAKKKPAKKVGKWDDPKLKKELQTLHKYVVKEERDFPTYDDLPMAQQVKRTNVWNKNLARGKFLEEKGVRAKGVPAKFFKVFFLGG